MSESKSKINIGEKSVHSIPAMMSELTYDNLRLHYVYQVSIYAAYELFKKVDLNNLDKNKHKVQCIVLYTTYTSSLSNEKYAP